MKNWINYDNRDNFVLSSRIRLARNINRCPFPHKLDCEKGRKIVKDIESALYVSDDMKRDYKSIYLWESPPSLNRTYIEKHLISFNLLNNKDKAAFILNSDETVSIMINEEDHIRLQCITAGFNMEEAFDCAQNIDNLLEKGLDYAFDEKLGYLTACPTNLGTGMRASVMIHLPALTMNNEMNGVLNALTQVGMTIRGLFGESSKTKSNIYQISNQITLGISEEDIINNLKAVVNQIINQEKLSRQNLMSNYKYDVEDRIYRALGILKSAVLLDVTECMDLISNVRMGVELGILKEVNIVNLNKLLVDTQPAVIKNKLGDNISKKEVDFNRAKIVREALK